MVAPKAVKTAQPSAAASGGALRPALPLAQWPDKKLFRIGELADLLGVETHVVRYWLKEFPQVHTERSDTNRLLFGRSAAEKLWRIRDLLYAQGYTLAGARKALAAGRPPKAREAGAGTGTETETGAGTGTGAEPGTGPVSGHGLPPAPSRAEVELARQLEALQAEVRALQARLAASQASEAAARVRAEQLDARAQQEKERAQQHQERAHQEKERADELAARLQQEVALAQHFQQALQSQQAQQAQLAQHVRTELEHQERERWSDFAALLGDLAADMRG